MFLTYSSWKLNFNIASAAAVVMFDLEEAAQFSVKVVMGTAC